MMDFPSSLALRYSSSPKTEIREVFAQVRKKSLPKTPMTLQRTFSQTDIAPQYIMKKR
jgi:hypothetical protein